MIRKIRDWWFGWSSDDLQSLAEKLKSEETKKPDGWILITERERRCLRYYNGIEGGYIKLKVTNAE